MKAFLPLLLLLLASCADYFDTPPDSTVSTRIDTPDKVAELLTAAYPRASYFPFLEGRTDNVEERAYEQHTRLMEAMFLWQDDDQDELDTPLNYWRACYHGIAVANRALVQLASMEKNERTRALYGEAFLLRAYLHFMLAQIWCDPYSEGNGERPGIPYVERPELNVLPVLKAIKTLYLDVYAAEGVGGARFLRGRTPLRIYLVGGRKWNAEGGELLAAPAASSIAMYVHGVNDFDPTSAASVYCLMRSVHYQAARRLLEVDGYDRATFMDISAARYLHAPQGVPSGNTVEERRMAFSTAAVSARQGFYSPFGRQDAEADLADMLSVSLCHTPAQTAAILAQAAQYEVQPEDPEYTAANAREAERVTAMLTQKVAFLQQHMIKAYPFSLLRLQLAAVQALQNYTAP